MEAPSYPDSVDEGLRAIRPTLRLVWNPKAVIDKPGSFDASGHSKEPTYGGRFEMWDTDPQGRDYRVFIVRNPDNSFKAPGQWIVDLMIEINPARFGGSVEKMLKHHYDKSDKMLLMHEKDAQDYDDAVAASWADYITSMKIQSAGIPGGN